MVHFFLRHMITAASGLVFDACVKSVAGNPRVTPEVTRDVCLLARMMAANLYYSKIEELMFEVFDNFVNKLSLDQVVRLYLQ